MINWTFDDLGLINLRLSDMIYQSIIFGLSKKIYRFFMLVCLFSYSSSVNGNDLHQKHSKVIGLSTEYLASGEKSISYTILLGIKGYKKISEADSFAIFFGSEALVAKSEASQLNNFLIGIGAKYNYLDYKNLDFYFSGYLSPFYTYEQFNLN